MSFFEDPKSDPPRRRRFPRAMQESVITLEQRDVDHGTLIFSNRQRLLLLRCHEVALGEFELVLMGNVAICRQDS
eukprot:766641-Hanusia_phi.AAC.2